METDSLIISHTGGIYIYTTITMISYNGLVKKVENIIIYKTMLLT